MPRRIDVELTSDRGDGSWTWRAAGARQPKGVVDAGLVPAGAKVGDVLRADADFDLDGVTVVGLSPIQEKRRNEPERIELLGRPQRDDQLVTSSLARGGRTDRRERPRRDRDRDRSPDRERGRDRSRGERTDRADRAAPRQGDHVDADHRADRGRRRREGAEGGRPRGERPARPSERRPPRGRPDEPSKPKPKRLRPGRVHRAAVLDELPPEHRPIAEQVLQGDIPAVRQAIEKENASRKERGEPTINGDELLGLAEKLRPRLRTAEWRDRADAALADVDDIDLRDLRSVVVAADAAARDDATRELAAKLREALARRVDSEQSSWLHDLTSALDSGRAVRALRLSSRPPKAGTILEPALTTRLTEAANSSLTADAPSDRWGVVLEAVAFSPVRLAVTPQSLPEKPSDALLDGVRRFAGRVPQVAAAFGIETTAGEPRARAPRKAVPPPPPSPTAPATGATGAPTESAEPAEPDTTEAEATAPEVTPQQNEAAAVATPTAAPEAPPARDEPEPVPPVQGEHDERDGDADARAASGGAAPDDSAEHSE